MYEGQIKSCDDLPPHNPEVCFRIDVAACPIVEGNCGSVPNHIETGKSKKHFHTTSFAAVDYECCVKFLSNKAMVETGDSEICQVLSLDATKRFSKAR